MLDWSLPYPSQREPVLARSVVATSQPLAAQVGLRTLLQGGNAVDAAVATAITLTVVEPTSNGIGADAFALVWDDGQLHGINASGRSPLALTRERFAGRDAMPGLGWDAVTVPGAVSSWVNLSMRFGRLPLELLFESAIDYAAEGFLVSPQTARGWARAADRYAAFPEFGRTFLPGGRAPRPGEVFACEVQARTLQLIAESEGEAFYRGELAECIAEAAGADGALLTARDLAEHRCAWVDPIALDYRDLTVHEIPPNGQGLAALIMLGIARHFDLASMGPDSADALHVQIEAMKLAFADAHRYVAEPQAMDIDPWRLLDEAYLAERAAAVDLSRAGDVGHGVPRYSSTVYLAVGDESGQMVSFIQSNFEGFGSGIVVPGTGIALQNRGAGFTLEEGHPNCVGPAKRPYHTIIPGFVTRRGADGARVPVMAFGVMGGPMQPQGHGQVVIRIADHGQNPQAALDAPRWRVESGRRVVFEPGFDPGVLDDLRGRGHEIELAPQRSVRHGGGQIVHVLDDGYCGASDLRRDGQAVGC